MKLPTSRERGISSVVVLVLLTVMLLGGLALARMAEVSTLISGNLAARNAALQASEVGVNSALVAVRGLSDEETRIAGWYWNGLYPTQTAQGLPDVTWDSAPSVTVGSYTVRYVVERVCQGAMPVTDAMQQCLVKEVDMPLNRTEDPNDKSKQLDNPYSTQFRVTVRVTDAKNTSVFVQSLVTKGSS